MTLLFIFGVIFAQSSFKEERGVLFIFNLLYVTPIFMILRYNTAPLSTIRSSQLLEYFVVLFDPLIIIPMIFTSILYVLDPYVQVTWFFLYILLSFEFTRQWLSFKLSKAATGATALGFTTLFITIAYIFESLDEFILIIYLSAIHLIFILIWMLTQLRKIKVSRVS